MEALIYLDTHVVAWLYGGEDERLSRTALDALREIPEIRISPMVRLELQYLYEIGRVAEPAAPVLDHLGSVLGVAVCPASFAAVVHEAERHTWTRDPFDRVIVAQASLHDAPLLTADAKLHRHYPSALW